MATARPTSYRNDPIFKALSTFEVEPLRSLVAAMAVIDARHDTDPIRWHLSMDTLCLFLLDKRMFLDVARAIAERLVALREDGCHCDMLARACAAQGDAQTAKDLFARAKELTDSHEPSLSDSNGLSGTEPPA